jgi:hypothetical protein
MQHPSPLPAFLDEEYIVGCMQNHGLQTLNESGFFIKGQDMIELYQGTNCGIYWAIQCAKCGFKCQCSDAQVSFMAKFGGRRCNQFGTFQAVGKILAKGYQFFGTWTSKNLKLGRLPTKDQVCRCCFEQYFPVGADVVATATSLSGVNEENSVICKM